jgi:site-specific recombinase XerD
VSSLNKIMKFQNPVYFNDINEKFVTDLRYFFKTKMNNCPATINTTIKALKKYVHIANKQGILTPIPYSEIKTKQFLGNRAFLMPLELVKLKDYYSSSFIKESYKNILSRFMFCCFTGLRLSDMRALTLDSFSENVLFFTAEKTTKIQRIKMNKSAMLFVGEKKVFEGNYTDQHINRELKEIATIVGITKKLSFHVSRHTFATNFLISGGRVEHLQKILGHSKITETMIYVNIVDQITDTQINNLDDIFGL